MNKVVSKAGPSALTSSCTGNKAILALSSTWAGEHLGPWAHPTDTDTHETTEIKLILKREERSGLRIMDK